jgi:hypothetical protein
MRAFDLDLKLGLGPLMDSAWKRRTEFSRSKDGKAGKDRRKDATAHGGRLSNEIALACFCGYADCSMGW